MEYLDVVCIIIDRDSSFSSSGRLSKMIKQNSLNPCAALMASSFFAYLMSNIKYTDNCEVISGKVGCLSVEKSFKTSVSIVFFLRKLLVQS